MRHCAFCDTELGEGIPDAPTSGRRHAYDPKLGRLWEICPRCRRWNPVPLELRWETLEGWERAVRDRGRVRLESEHLALMEVDGGEVVRVGHPPFVEWGGWRYGDHLPELRLRRGFLARILGSLPPAPLEGYDPYGLTGPMGGVGGSDGPSEWLASPFLEQATPLTMAFASVPFAPRCPSCGIPMPLNPWDFQRVTFRRTEAAGEEETGIEAPCAYCGTLVVLPLVEARPALRMGLAILDSGPEARAVGAEAGRGLDRVGGARAFVEGLGRLGVPLGEIRRDERVALGIALDQAAEAEALEREWRESEEIIAVMDGELTEVEGFREFRARILDGS